jgi:hypothetical protein
MFIGLAYIGTYTQECPLLDFYKNAEPVRCLKSTFPSLLELQNASETCTQVRRGSYFTKPWRGGRPAWGGGVAATRGGWQVKGFKIVWVAPASNASSCSLLGLKFVRMMATSVWKKTCFQGDRIGRIFAYWVIVFFEQFFFILILIIFS